LETDLDKPVLEAPDFTPSAIYGTQSRYGFVKLSLTDDFGQDDYQAAFVRFLRKDKDPADGKDAPDPGTKPVGPTAAGLSMSYTTEELVLNTSDKTSFDKRPGQFFHLTPFGTAEQHPYLNGKDSVDLFPHFEFIRDTATVPSEAEFYIGVAGLV